MKRSIRFLILVLLMFLNVVLYAKPITLSNNWNHVSIYVVSSVQEVDLLRDGLKDSGSEATYQLFSHSRPGELLRKGAYKNKIQ